jgi:Oxidoreductase family, NAD-binding Rossmann fold
VAGFPPKRADGANSEATTFADGLLMVRVVLFGAGATGARVARQLRSSGVVSCVEVRDAREEKAQRLVDTLGAGSELGRGRPIDANIDAVVVATPAGSQAALARKAVHSGVPVITTSNQTSEVRRLLALDQEARHQDVPVIVGAGFMPGFTGLLAKHGATEFDHVDEIHVAKVGTGGPACARQHHRALSSTGIDWRDGRWTTRAPGSGRELAYFPDPIGGRDCYRAALPDALLLVPEFNGVDRVTARMAATRRDRLTAPLPMLRRPHAEGGIGAVRVELRGRVGIERRVSVFGAIERPAVAAGAIAASTTLFVLRGAAPPGAYGLAGLPDPLRLMADIASRGVRPMRFEGVSTFV